MSIAVAQFQSFLLAFTRIGAMITQVPVLGGNSVPIRVRVGLVFLLTIIILPGNIASPEDPGLSLLPLVVALARELLIGFIAGFAAAMVFAAMQVAGTVMGLGSGFASGQILNPAIENTGSALNNFFVIVTMLYFLVIDAHHLFILGIQYTFDVAPLFGPMPAMSVNTVIRMMGDIFTTGVQLGLPVMAPVLLTDITLSLLARVAPQIQVFFLGIPLKVGVGLLGLSMAIIIILPTLRDLFESLAPRAILLLGG